MSNRWISLRLIVFLMVLVSLVPLQHEVLPVQAAPLAQMDWQQQCQLGQTYYLLDQVLDSKRLLESGLAAVPDSPADATTAGFCAFWLGHLHVRTTNFNGALDSFIQAEAFFDQADDTTMVHLMKLVQTSPMLAQGSRSKAKEILDGEVLPYVTSSSPQDWPSSNLQTLVEAATLTSLGLSVGLDDEFLADDTAGAREYFHQALELVDNIHPSSSPEYVLSGRLSGLLTSGIDLSQVVACVREYEASVSGQVADMSICTKALMRLFLDQVSELGDGIPGFLPGGNQGEEEPGTVSPELIKRLFDMVPDDGETPDGLASLENLNKILKGVAEQQASGTATPELLPESVDDIQDTDIDMARLQQIVELLEDPEGLDITTLSEVFLGINPFDAIGAQVAPMFKPILLNNIAETYRYEDNPDEALEYYRQALDAADELRKNDTLPGYQVYADIAEGIVLNNEGLLYFDQAKESQEQSNVSMAWEKYTQALTNYDITFQRMQEFRQHMGVASVLVNRSQVKLRLAELLEDDPTLDTNNPVLLREDAFADLHTAVQEVETIRVAGDNRVRDIVARNKLGAGSVQALSGSLSPSADVFNFAVLLSHQLGDDALAFEFGERGRARLLLDMLTTGQLELSDPAAQTLINQEREQFIMRQLAEDVLEQARNSEDEQYRTIIPALEKQLSQAEEVYQETRSTIQQQYPRLMALLGGNGGILSAEGVQQELQRLDEPTTLVTYYVIDERVEKDAPSLAFVINTDRPDVTAIELTDATSAHLVEPFEQLGNWYGGPSDNNTPNNAFQEFHRALIKPLQDAEVLTTMQLGIVPHQQLHYIPFAALNDGAEYLVEQHALFVLPSASVLKLANDELDIQSPTDAPVALVYGNPTSGHRDSLNHAEDEARAIAAMFDSISHTRDEATEQRLRVQAENVHLIHLSVHAEHLRNNELQSPIYLAEDADKQHDGILRAAEILVELSFPNTELVVLSACETSAGTPSTGDEIVSLVRSLITAGSASVVASLWSVEDQSSEKLMTSFYRAWQKDGLNKAAALREAQLESLNIYENPYYWGAFVLYGNPNVGKVKFEIAAETSTPASTATIEPGSTVVPTETNGSPASPGCFSFGVILIGAVCYLWWSRRLVVR